MSNFELPHADRVIGEKKEHEKEFKEWLQEKRQKIREKIQKFEIEKTERDKEIIEFANRSVDEHLGRYGRKRKVDVPLEDIHVLKDGGVEELTQGKTFAAVHYPVAGKIIIDRIKSDIDFSLRIFHELLHAKSYKALQRTIPKDELKLYRSGFNVFSRDGKKWFFRDIDEAIVSMVEKRFFKEKIAHNPFFQVEKEQPRKKHIFGHPEERKKLNEFIDLLWKKNKDTIESRSAIVDMFIEAQATGKLLKVARLIENTFGKGSFRQLGEKSGRIDRSTI